MAKLKETSENKIAISFLVINLMALLLRVKRRFFGHFLCLQKNSVNFDKNKFNRDLVQQTMESPHPKGRIWVKGELGLKLDDFMQEQFKNGYSGQVLVVKNGEKILYKGYGLADRANGFPNKVTTLFDAGSIMKDFTEAAILKLETEGKLSTEDSITKFLKNLPKDKQGITYTTSSF